MGQRVKGHGRQRPARTDHECPWLHEMHVPVQKGSGEVCSKGVQRMQSMQCKPSQKAETR
eukprot:scaffold262573_cov17-Tisochrysis_lutea.AAC.1